MSLFICVTVLLATATNALNSSQVNSEVSTAQTTKGSLTLEPEPSAAQNNELPELVVNCQEGHVGEEQIDGGPKNHSEDPLIFHYPNLHSSVNDNITSTEEKGQEEVTSKVNKVSDRANDISATEDNQASERQLVGETIKDTTQSLCTGSQIEDVCVTPADISEKNQVPRVNENAMPAANQNTSDMSEMIDVFRKNDSMPEKEQTTEQSITETNLPKVATTPTAPPCPLLWPECPKQDLDNATADVARDLSAFALELFKAVKSNRPNVVVSPISIALALSQLMLGAGGNTKEELLKTLYRSVNNQQCVHDAIRKLINFDSLLTANEIFYNKDIFLYGEYINQSTRLYGSKGIPLFKDKKRSIEKINSWVSKKTKSLIPELLQELSHDLQLMLINVIYYQGKWISRFNPKHTRTEKFHSSHSRPVTVKMMNAHKYPLQNTRDSYLDAQVARFPLSDNCSLLIFMPVSNTADSLKTMEGKLTGEVMTQLMTLLEQMDPRATTVYIPQLNLDSDLDLNEVLRLVGLFGLFEYPDFCALSNSTGLVVSDVHHRVILEVKEEGVKAAVATSVTVARTVSVFAVRKPFLFIIASDRSKIPILIGRVTDPSLK